VEQLTQSIKAISSYTKGVFKMKWAEVIDIYFMTAIQFGAEAATHAYLESNPEHDKYYENLIQYFNNVIANKQFEDTLDKEFVEQK